MAPRPSRNNARLLAPAALVLAFLAVVIVLASSGGDGGDDSNGTPASDTLSGTTPKTTAAQKAPAKKKATTYTVKTGDSLGSIAAKNDLTTEKLQELNPDVDPQSLVAGQKIKLTE